MNITMKYGNGTIDLDLSAASSIDTIEPTLVPALPDLKKAVFDAVDCGAVASPPLKELVHADDLVTIVISDLTRFWMRQDQLCTHLVDYLHRILGVRYDNIVVVIAVGTHRAQTEDELKTLVTPEIYEKVTVVNHDSKANDLVFLGTTQIGTDVWINKLAVDRKLILIGGTVHHLMAGFGGGRKSILPGICGYQTVMQNHSHALDPELPQSSDLIGLACTQENPVHLDMTQAAQLANPTYSLNVVVNSQNEHCSVVGGHWFEAWKHSCVLAQQAIEVPFHKKADTVIVSCGGYPKDINLYQGIKSFFNACQAVKENGDVVFLCQSIEGGGPPEFFDWAKPLEQGVLEPTLRKNFTIAGYIFFAFYEMINRCHCVHILTDIPQEVLAPLGLKAYQTVEELSNALDLSGKEVIVMPYGGSTVPQNNS